MSEPKPLYEVERKRTFEGSIEGFLKMLDLHEFTQQEEFREIDTYYSRPDVDFMETVECLRTRERDAFAEVTYKPASTTETSTNDGVTIKEETNLPISPSDIHAAQQLLRNLGMIRLVEVNKFRRTYTSPNHHALVLSIDDIKGVGIFIETEITSSDRARALDDLDSVEKLLGISTFAVVTRPYRDLCMEKGV